MDYFGTIYLRDGIAINFVGLASDEYMSSYYKNFGAKGLAAFFAYHALNKYHQLTGRDYIRTSSYDLEDEIYRYLSSTPPDEWTIQIYYSDWAKVQ